ncbi:acyl-CoA dehydrogenase family protein [Saccharomonospora sp. CUA-673]|uniref:acyl-CoA dehydrogenase family protein n=1 Tax=Saccharomonospora sp. CUA-673 TaxID=1904969 RepID=UPI002100AFC1|nr:acyl-CoA dehydrogenase family protein [Saccharomonospora sp. CUA-673]
MGKHVAAEPLLDAAFLPSWLIAAFGTDEQVAELLPAVAEGTPFAVAHAEPGRAWGAAPSVTASAGADGAVTLTGVKSPVRHADQAATLLVTAVADGATGVYVVDAGAAGMTRTDGRSADWSRAAQVEFAGTPAVRLGGGVGGVDDAAALRAAFARARVAVLGEVVGLMETGLALTVEYLKTRKQFGVPLSTFQALVHRASDLYARVELARSMALWATATVEAHDSGAVGADEFDSVADDAFVFVGDAAIEAAEEIVQLHGGIGMTYESTVAHHAARLTAITESFGGVAAARRRAVASDAVLTPPSALVGNVAADA